MSRSAASALQISLCCQQLRHQERASGRAAERIVRQTHEFPVEQGILAQTSRADAHTAADIPIQTGLRTVFFLKIRDELLGRVRKLQLLRYAAEAAPCL